MPDKQSSVYKKVAEAIIILSPIGPFYVLRQILRERKAKVPTFSYGQQLIALAKLQTDVESTIDELQIPRESASYYLYKSILNKIKQLPPEQQIAALYELKEYINMVERGASEAELKNYIEGTVVLGDVLREMTEE